MTCEQCKHSTAILLDGLCPACIRENARPDSLVLDTDESFNEPQPEEAR